jgi:hypothetical protein
VNREWASAAGELGRADSGALAFVARGAQRTLWRLARPARMCAPIPAAHTCAHRHPSRTIAAPADAAGGPAALLRPAARALSAALLAAAAVAGPVALPSAAAPPALAAEEGAVAGSKAPDNTVYFGNGCFW